MPFAFDGNFNGLLGYGQPKPRQAPQRLGAPGMGGMQRPQGKPQQNPMQLGGMGQFGSPNPMQPMQQPFGGVNQSGMQNSLLSMFGQQPRFWGQMNRY